MSRPDSNFTHLARLQEDLARLGMAAERYFAEDPNTCLLKLRQYAELMAQQVAARAGIYRADEDNQATLLSRLKREGWLPRETADLFHWLRKAGNEANHAFRDDHRTALDGLKIANQLGYWFQRTFADPAFKGGAFIPPRAPVDESGELRKELDRLDGLYRAEQDKATAAGQRLVQAQEEARVWEALAQDGEAAIATLEAQLAELQAKATAEDYRYFAGMRQNAEQAASLIHLDEAAIRELIDQQLREAGWEADTRALRHGNGTRPQLRRNLAIAEWPTDSGPADYALFVGTECVAVVEAKRGSRNVSAAIDQARRYAVGLRDEHGAQAEARWGEFRVPLVFATNGRPFQQQFKEVSGIWFCDLRRPQNHRRALDGWYTPEGIRELLKQDHAAAERKGRSEQTALTFGFQRQSAKLPSM